MRRVWWQWFGGVAGAMLALELVFQILPVSTSTATDYYNDPLILSYPPHHRWTASTGWDLRNAHSVLANAQGFVADKDFTFNGNAVALVGDSFVEASMLPAAERPGAQLERALQDRPVFAMGGPGSALLDYAERIRFANEKFGVRDFVVLMETGDVKQSLCGSGNVHGPCLDRISLQPRIETKPTADMAKRAMRHSALAQYLFSQLKVNPQPAWAQVFAPRANQTANGNAASNSAATAAVTQAFFARIKPLAIDKLVIVIDTDRQALYQGKDAHDPERTRFINLARAAGARVVDAEAQFRAHLATSPLKLDVSPGDAHLNALGVKLVTRAAALELVKP